MRQNFSLIAGLLALMWIGNTRAASDFSGEWVSRTPSTAKSDSGNDASPERQHHGRGGRGSGMAGHGGGMGSHAGGMGGHRGWGRQPDADKLRREQLRVNGDPRLNAHALVIRQSSVVFDVDADGVRQVFRFDNRHAADTRLAGNGTISWLGDELQLKTAASRGRDIVERYSLSSDNKLLIVRIHQAGADPPDITHVYVRAGSDDGSRRGPSLP